MDSDDLQEIESALQEAVNSAFEEHMDDLKNYMKDLINEAVESAFDEHSYDLADNVADELDDKIDNAIDNSLRENIAEGIEDFFRSGKFVIKTESGETVIQAGKRTRVVSPDKTKTLVCYGGVRIDGYVLQIQTRIHSWETLCVYHHLADAKEAVKKINEGNENGVPLIEL